MNLEKQRRPEQIRETMHSLLAFYLNELGSQWRVLIKVTALLDVLFKNTYWLLC
jgi:hypothetical protein